LRFLLDDVRQERAVEWNPMRSSVDGAAAGNPRAALL
jgi:hypothetical protein